MPIEAPICNPVIAAKSVDSLQIGHRKLHRDDDVESLHPDLVSSPFSSLPFTNGDVGSDPVLNVKIAAMAEMIASWSDWSYPKCSDK